MSSSIDAAAVRDMRKEESHSERKSLITLKLSPSALQAVEQRAPQPSFGGPSIHAFPFPHDTIVVDTTPRTSDHGPNDVVHPTFGAPGASQSDREAEPHLSYGLTASENNIPQLLGESRSPVDQRLNLDSQITLPPIQPWESPLPARKGPMLQKFRLSKQSQVIPLTADGKLACPLGCEETFSQKSIWQIHMNRHTLPFRCSREDCDRSITGFSTKDQLRRHDEAHKRLNGEKIGGPFQCCEAGCPYTTDGFTRKYELRTHYLRAHSEAPLPHYLTSKVVRASNSAGNSMSPDLVASDTNKRKWDQLGHDESVQNDPKKGRTLDRVPPYMTPREYELIKENQKLKEQLEQSNRTIQGMEIEADGYHEMIQRCLDVIEELAE